MEWTNDGRLLVSEHTAGQVTDITAGGDMRDAKPVATGLQGPTSILPLADGRILVSEMWSGRITDIAQGGDVSSVDPFAEGLKGPYSLSQIGGSVFVVEHPSATTAQITEIHGRHDHRPYVTNVPGLPLNGMEGLTPPSSWPDRWSDMFFACSDWKTPIRLDGTDSLVLNSSVLGQLLQIPDGGGSFSSIADTNAVLARGLGHMGGMIQRPNTDELFLTLPKEGSILSINLRERGKDYRFTPPVVRGLNMPSCVRFSPSGDEMLVCSFAVGGVWKISGW